MTHFYAIVPGVRRVESHPISYVTAGKLVTKARAKVSSFGNCRTGEYDRYHRYYGVSGLNDVDGNVGVGIVGAKADGVGGGSEESVPKYKEPMLGNLCAKSGMTSPARLSRSPVSWWCDRF